MKRICLHEKAMIEETLRRDEALHLYELGDLDAFFWPQTTWYGLLDGDCVKEIALLYTGGSLPVLLALSGRPDSLVELLESLLPLLPRRIYAHLSPPAEEVLARAGRVRSHGRHLKMLLKRPAAAAAVDGAGVRRLGRDDLDDLLALYEAGYPGNWFDPRMLETAEYFGWGEARALRAAAGVHVFSPEYGVAALGNIVTHPEHRGRGLATRVTAALCRSLVARSATVGLNVKADNAVALLCYERLGFEVVGEYGEYEAQLT